jgi:hypothetical protein
MADETNSLKISFKDSFAKDWKYIDDSKLNQIDSMPVEIVTPD